MLVSGQGHSPGLLTLYDPKSHLLSGSQFPHHHRDGGSCLLASKALGRTFRCSESVGDRRLCRSEACALEAAQRQNLCPPRALCWREGWTEPVELSEQLQPESELAPVTTSGPAASFLWPFILPPAQRWALGDLPALTPSLFCFLVQSSVSGPPDIGRAGRNCLCWHPEQSPLLCQQVDWTPPGLGHHPRPLIQGLALGFQNAEEVGGRTVRAKPLLVSFHALGRSAQAPTTLCFLQSKIQASSYSLRGSPVQDSLRGQTSSGPDSPWLLSPSLVPGSSGSAELPWVQCCLAPGRTMEVITCSLDWNAGQS